MQTNTPNKWIHIIGIAGVTTSAIALEFLTQGWKVTGSDKNTYSPVKEILNNSNVTYYTNFSYKHLVIADNSEEKYPDLVILGSAILPKNKELLFAKKRNMNITSYPQIVKKHIISEESIVIAGTFGKTSIASLLVYIHQKLNTNISYLFGGFSEDIDKNLRFKDKNTKRSIVEGDEYLTSKIDRKSKFFYYHPKILILNAIEWDHTDLFKSEEDYIKNFKKLVSEVPPDGVIFANNSENINKVIQNAKCTIVHFDFKQYEVQTGLIGKFNKENAAVANQVAQHLGLKKQLVENAILDFKGIKRRLEVRFETDKIIIIDDFGSSPAKAKGAIETIKEEYPSKKIIIVYEPNEGARTQEALKLYKNLFNKSDHTFFPTFREIPERINALELSKFFPENQNIKYEPDNKKLINQIIDITKNSEKNFVICFLGSHDFEGMITKLITTFKNDA